MEPGEVYRRKIYFTGQKAFAGRKTSRPFDHDFLFPGNPLEGMRQNTFLHFEHICAFIDQGPIGIVDMALIG